MVTDFDWKACWKLQSDEVLQLLEVGIAGGHQVDDGQNLFLKRQRVFLGQPQLRFELLNLTGLFHGPPDIFALQIELTVEILFRSEVAGVVHHARLLEGINKNKRIKKLISYLGIPF